MVVKIDRKRYLKVDFYGEQPEIGKFISALRKKVIKLAGEIFLASSALHVIDYQDSGVIVRCNHISRTTIEAAIQLVDFPNFCLIIRTISGTLKSLNSKLVDNFNGEVNDDNLDDIIVE